MRAAGVLVGGGSTRRSTAPTARSSPRCRCRSPTGAPRTARPGCCCPTRACRSRASARSGLRLAEPEAVGAAGGPAAARAAGCAAGDRRGRARRPRRPRGGRGVDGRGRGRPRRRPGPGGARRARCSPWSRPPGRRRASCRGWPSWRCPTPTAAGRRRGSWCCPGSPLAAVLEPRARSGMLDAGDGRDRRPRRAARGRRPRHVRAGPRRGPRRPGRRRRRPTGPTPCSTGCRADAPAAGVAAADRGPRPGAGRATGAGRCRCWPRCPPRRGPTCVLGGVPVPGYLRWWLSTHPVLGGRRPDRLRHPDSTELQGLYEPATAGPRGPRPAAPAGDGRRRARRRRRRDRPAGPARRPGPHGAARRAADGLRPAGRGARRRRRRPAGAGPGRAGPGGRGRRRPRRAVPAATGRRAGRAGRRRARARWPTCSTCRWPASWCGGSVTGRADGGCRWAELPGAALAAARLGVDRAGRARSPCTTTLTVGRPAGRLVAGRGRRPRRRDAGRAGPGAGLAGRRLVAAPGAGRGVRLPRPRRRAGRRGRGRGLTGPLLAPARDRPAAPGAWPWVDGRPPARRPPAARGPRGPVRPSSSTANSDSQCALVSAVGRVVGGSSSWRSQRTPAVPGSWARSSGTQRGGRRGEDGAGEPVERDVLRLGERGAGVGGGAGRERGQGVTRGTSGRGRDASGDERAAPGRHGRGRRAAGRSAEAGSDGAHAHGVPHAGDVGSGPAAVERITVGLLACRAWWASQRARSRARASVLALPLLRALAGAGQLALLVRGVLVPVAGEEGDDRSRSPAG